MPLAAHASAWAQVPAIGEPWQVRQLPGSSSNAAYEPLPAGPLTLFQLTDYALRNNAAVRSAWSLAREDVAKVAAAQALLRPIVTASVPLTAAHGAAPAAAGSTASAAAPNGSMSYALAPTLGLSWVLFDGGARAASVDAARWQAASTQLAYNRSLQTIVSNVEQAYYALLVARQLEVALHVGVDSAQASVDVTRAKRSSGLATVGETSQAEAALAQARLWAVQASATSRSAAGGLASAVGAPVATVLPLVGDDRFDALFPPGQLEDLLQRARVSRADLTALGAQVQQAQAEVVATEAQGRPSLTLGASVNQGWNRNGGVTVSAATQQIGLTLSIPIFDGGLVRAQTQAARARLQTVMAERELQRQTVDLEVWQSYQSAESSEAAVSAADALLRSALVAEEAARERYRSGVGLLIELLSAQTTAAQARASLVQARYDGLIALSKLGYAVGASSTMASRAVGAALPRRTDLSSTPLPAPHEPRR